MKIRNGFVSNSSSSSFIVVGTYIPFNKIMEAKNPYFLGEWLSDGMDFFEVPEKLKEYLSKFDDESCYKIMDVDCIGEEDLVINNVVRGKLIRSNVITSISADYHTSDGLSLEEFMEKYP